MFWIDTEFVQKEGQTMCQQYEEISMHILNAMKTERKGKSSISTTRTSIRKLWVYMQSKGLQYTPEIAAEWLEMRFVPFQIMQEATNKSVLFITVLPLSSILDVT